jgi:acyl carrier protein
MSQAIERPLSRDSVLERVREILVESFELEPTAIQLDSRLVDDLDLDSIDAIDLAVELEQETGLRVEEQELRQIRLVGDIVDLVCSRLALA